MRPQEEVTYFVINWGGWMHSIPRNNNDNNLLSKRYSCKDAKVENGWQKDRSAKSNTLS